MTSTQDIITQADELYRKGAFSDCLGLLKNAYDDGNDDAEILWRLARANFTVADEMTEKEKDAKKPFIEAGAELAKKCVEKDPENWAGQMYCGVLISELGPYQSTNDKIGGVTIIRDHFKKALELNPKDAQAAYAMGLWCFKVVQVTWLERKAASLLFSAPPTSTYEEAEEYFLLSEKLSEEAPNVPSVQTRVCLGDLYYEQKKKAEAKEWYLKAAQTEGVSKSHARSVEHAKKRAGKC